MREGTKTVCLSRQLMPAHSARAPLCNGRRTATAPAGATETTSNGWPEPAPRRPPIPYRRRRRRHERSARYGLLLRATFRFSSTPNAGEQANRKIVVVAPTQHCTPSCGWSTGSPEHVGRQRVFGGGWQALQRGTMPVLPARRRTGASRAHLARLAERPAQPQPPALLRPCRQLGSRHGCRQTAHACRGLRASRRGCGVRLPGAPPLCAHQMGAPYRRIPKIETQTRQPFAVLLRPGAVEPDQSPHGAAPQRHAVQLPGRGRRRMVVGRRRSVPGRGARLPAPRLPRRRPCPWTCPASSNCSPSYAVCPASRSARPSLPTRSPARTIPCLWPCSRPAWASPSCTSMPATSPMPRHASIPRRAGASAMPSSPCAARARWWASSKAATCRRRAGGNADGRPAASPRVRHHWTATRPPSTWPAARSTVGPRGQQRFSLARTAAILIGRLAKRAAFRSWPGTPTSLPPRATTDAPRQPGAAPPSCCTSHMPRRRRCRMSRPGQDEDETVSSPRSTSVAAFLHGGGQRRGARRQPTFPLPCAMACAPTGNSIATVSAAPG